MQAAKDLEIEVKFRVDDPGKVKERLKGIGARVVSSGMENNIKFDDGERRMKKADELLRLRQFNGSADITHKRRAKGGSPEFLVREEIIVNIDSFERGKKLLEAIGFRPVGKYEKKRETWELGSVGILIDIMPHMGAFVEIEGTEREIEETAAKLGLDMKEAIKKDYGKLFEEYCRERGLEGAEMTFGEGKG